MFKELSNLPTNDNPHPQWARNVKTLTMTPCMLICCHVFIAEH